MILGLAQLALQDSCNWAFTLSNNYHLYFTGHNTGESCGLSSLRTHGLGRLRGVYNNTSYPFDTIPIALGYPDNQKSCTIQTSTDAVLCKLRMMAHERNGYSPGSFEPLGRDPRGLGSLSRTNTKTLLYIAVNP